MSKYVALRIHTAVFIPNKGNELPRSMKGEFYFLNVINNYKTKSIIIKEIRFMNNLVNRRDRPLPIMLRPGKSWETWIKAVKDLEKPFACGHMLYEDNGTTYLILSTERKNVPPKGEVPNGK